MPRPLLQKTIVELEQLFSEWQSSPDQLRVLKSELDHRKRPKAVRLREKVDAILVGNDVREEDPAKTTQQELWPGATDSPERRPRRRSLRAASVASTNTQDYLAPLAVLRKRDCCIMASNDVNR